MTVRLGLIAAMLILWLGALSCGGGGGQDTEAGVTAGGEAKRLQIEAEFAEKLGVVRPGETDPIVIADGVKQFKRKCAFCHGVDGMKRIPFAQESAHRVSGFAPDDIAVQVHSGVNIHGKVRNHKIFPTLKGGELYATILFVQNFFLQGKGEDPFADWKTRIATGEGAFGIHCMSCHATVKGPAEPAALVVEPAEVDPAIAAAAVSVEGPTFDREYLLSQSPQHMRESIAANEAHAGKGFGESLSEEDQWAVAYWLQSLLYELP